MDLQLSYLEKERSYSSDSGTLYVDLPSNEQISVLFVDFSVSNTAPTSRLYSRTILDVVSKIEVLLDGHKAAYSMPPEVGGYCHFFQTGKVPPYYVRERGTTAIRLPILFGRFPGDPEYMLDTGLYKSAQLQIPYELNTTYETTGTTQLTAWILRPVDRVSPRGFIRSRTVNLYTSSGSAEVKEVDLPTGLPWYHVGFRIWDIDAFIENNLTDVILDIDEGRLRLFDGRIEDLKRLNQGWFGPDVLGVPYWALTQNGQNVQHLQADPDVITWSHYAAGIVIYGSSSIWSNRHTIRMYDDSGTAVTTNRDFMVQAKGGHPFSCLSIGNFKEEPFPAQQHDDALIEFTIGAYACEFETFVQEVVEGTL